MNAPPPLSEKVLRNTLFNSLGRLWYMAIAFILTPYILANLGVERFGIWSLAFALTSYLALMDLGLSQSFMKFVAEHAARKEVGEINRVVTTGLVFYFALSLAFATLGLSFAEPIVRLFPMDSALVDEAIFVFRGAVLVLCIANLVNVLQGLIMGLQRMDVTNKVLIVTSSLYALGVIAVLRLDYGLQGLIVMQLLQTTLNGLLLAVAVSRVFPQLNLTLSHLSRRTLGRLLSFGIKVQAGGVANLIGGQVDRVLIGYFLGLGFVGLYEVAARVIAAVKTIALLLVSALVPATSELGAAQNTDRLLELYYRGSKYLALVASFLTAFVVSLAPVVLLAWVGPGYGQAVWLIVALGIGHWAHTLTGVGTSVARGIGKPEMEMRYSILVVALTAILGVMLIGGLGFLGVLLASPLSLVAGSLYFLVVFHRHIRLPLRPFVRAVYPVPALAAGAAGGLLWGFYFQISGLGSALWGRGAALGFLALVAIGFGVFVGAIIWLTRYLDASDYALLRRLLHIVDPRQLVTR